MNKSEEILGRFVDGVKKAVEQTYGDTMKKMAQQIASLKKERDSLLNSVEELRTPTETYSDKYIPSLKEAVIVWGVEDVLERANENNIEMSIDTANQVLYLLKKNHDATIGINWDTIDHWVDYYADHKEEFHQ